MKEQSNTIYIEPRNEEEWISRTIDTFGGERTEYGVCINNERAQVNMISLAFLKDVTFYVSEMYFEEELVIRELKEPEPQILIRIVRSGELKWTGDKKGSIGKRQQHGASMYSTKHASDLIFPGKTKIQILIIRMSLDYWLMQAGSTFPELRKLAVSEKPWIVYEELSHKVESDLDQLFELNKSQDIFTLGYCLARCLDIFTAVAQKINNRIEKHGPIDMLDVDTQILFQIKTDLEEHINQPPNLEELAQKYAMSVSKLSNNFKNAFGLRPKQYVILFRLKEAKYRIEYSKEPLTTIAEDLGFSDLAHLSSQYKKQFGESPSQMRERKTGLS